MHWLPGCSMSPLTVAWGRREARVVGSEGQAAQTDVSVLASSSLAAYPADANWAPVAAATEPPADVR